MIVYMRTLWMLRDMKAQYYSVFCGGWGALMSHPLEHDEKLPQTFDPRTGTLKQDLTPSEYGKL